MAGWILLKTEWWELKVEKSDKKEEEIKPTEDKTEAKNKDDKKEDSKETE